jgi:hypothetical protein
MFTPPWRGIPLWRDESMPKSEQCEDSRFSPKARFFNVSMSNFIWILDFELHLTFELETLGLFHLL